MFHAFSEVWPWCYLGDYTDSHLEWINPNSAHAIQNPKINYRNNETFPLYNFKKNTHTHTKNMNKSVVFDVNPKCRWCVKICHSANVVLRFITILSCKTNSIIHFSQSNSLSFVASTSNQSKCSALYPPRFPQIHLTIFLVVGVHWFWRLFSIYIFYNFAVIKLFWWEERARETKKYEQKNERKNR